MGGLVDGKAQGAVATSMNLETAEGELAAWGNLGFWQDWHHLMLPCPANRTPLHCCRCEAGRGAPYKDIEDTDVQSG